MEWNESEYEAVLRQFQPRKPSLPPAMLVAPRRRGLWIGAAAAMILLGILSIWILRRPQATETRTIAEVDGPLFRVSGQDTLPITVAVGDVLRSQGGSALYALEHGPRLEMRSQSEVSVERAEDGLRLNLQKGAVIVDAAKQTDSRVSVKTRDITVSFSLGTVLFVGVEEEGSRVAVVEGQARVEMGVISRDLRSSEQLATNPQMQLLSMPEQVAWSRHANELLVRLLRKQTAPAAPASQHPEQRLAFEVVSIGSSLTPLPGGYEGLRECSGLFANHASRFVAQDITLYRLILLAYGHGNCDPASRAGLLSGGPEWIKSERFDIEAIMGDDIPPLPGKLSPTTGSLERMIQSLLADRFKLVLHREMKESQEVLIIDRVERPLAN